MFARIASSLFALLLLVLINGSAWAQITCTTTGPEVACNFSDVTLGTETYVTTIQNGYYIKLTNNTNKILQLNKVKILEEQGQLSDPAAEFGVYLNNFVTGQAPTWGFGEVGGTYRLAGESPWLPIIHWGCDSTSCTRGLQVPKGAVVYMGGNEHGGPARDQSYWVTAVEDTSSQPDPNSATPIPRSNAVRAYRWPQWDVSNACNPQSTLGSTITTESRLLKNTTSMNMYFGGATIFAQSGTTDSVEKACFIAYDQYMSIIASNCTSGGFDTRGVVNFSSNWVIPPGGAIQGIAKNTCSVATDAWGWVAYSHIWYQ